MLTPLALWVWWMHRNGIHGLSRGRAVVALVVRLALLGLFLTLLAEPRSVRSTDRLSVVFALDSSDSIGRTSSEKGAEYIAKVVSNKPDQDEAGLVTFASNAAVELPPGEAFPLEGGSIILTRASAPMRRTSNRVCHSLRPCCRKTHADGSCSSAMELRPRGI